MRSFSLSNLPLVSVITVNWNNTLVTCDLLRSINENNTYSNIEIIVVDNASFTDPTETFLSEYSSAKVIRNQENLGFSGGNNVGIRASKGEYFQLRAAIIWTITDFPGLGSVSGFVTSGEAACPEPGRASFQ